MEDCRKNNLTWQQLAEFNTLKNPHIIFPGQVLKLSAVLKERGREFVAEKVMVSSRGIEIPAIFTYPKGTAGEKFPLVVYGYKDDVIPPEVDKEVVKAAVKSVKASAHVVVGADHGFGLFSTDPALSTETVNTTVDFLAGQL